MPKVLHKIFVRPFTKFVYKIKRSVNRKTISNCKAMSATDCKDGSDAATASPDKKVQKRLGKCEFIKKEEIASGKWLRLNYVTFRDPTGKERVWEALERTTKQAGGAADAVIMMTTLKRLLHYDCLICVKQYRPPLQAYTLEFPAGLIDKNEKPEVAALRELKEETGYVGVVKHCSPPVSLDGGTENSTIIIVTVEVDGDDEVNKNPKGQPDDGEFIEVLHIPINEFLTRCNELSAEGVTIDARLYAIAITLEMTTKEKRVEPELK